MSESPLRSELLLSVKKLEVQELCFERIAHDLNNVLTGLSSIESLSSSGKTELLKKQVALIEERVELLSSAARSLSKGRLPSHDSIAVKDFVSLITLELGCAAPELSAGLLEKRMRLDRSAFVSALDAAGLHPAPKAEIVEDSSRICIEFSGFSGSIASLEPGLSLLRLMGFAESMDGATLRISWDFAA